MLKGCFKMKLQNNHKARLFLFVLFKIALATVACGKTIYVDDDSAGANNGTSWTDAYVFLQDALADANDSDKPVEIHVAQGIYTPDRGAGQTPGDREATFQLINGVSLTGGYTGVDANDPNARDIELYETILSGDLNGNDAAVDDLQTLYYETTRYDNSYSVVTAEYTDETAVLDGVTITAGMANIDTLSSVNQQCGGGFYCYEARPVIANCTFELNVARRGAGIYNSGGEPSLINCRFVNNVAICDLLERGRGCYGSGLYNIYGKPVLTNCEFIENYGDYGAGISIHRSDNVTITNCLFKQNRVSSKGGGMHCEDNNNLSIINCRFIENYNSGRYDSGDGGAIYIITGDYLLIDCKFENNHTNYTGGGISNSDAYVFIKNCLFAENSAGNAGGAINFRENTAEVRNCTISNNSAHAGGGLYFGYEEQTVASNVKITNSILWGNRGQIYNGNHSEITITYSCIQDFIIGRAGAKMGIINHEPIFAEPGYWADVNDPNVAVDPDDPNAVWVDGDYHLKSQAGRWDPNSDCWVIDDVTSPCIDAGDPNSPVGDELYPNGGRINMGAYGGTREASMSLETGGLSLPDVAFIYFGKNEQAESFQSLLESYGCPTTLIKTKNVTATSLESCDLVIVANDTFYSHAWTEPNAIAAIEDSDKPIVGLGDGGHDFFGLLGLSIGSHGAGFSQNNINVIEPPYSIFSTPYPIDIPQDGVLQLYTETRNVALYLWPDVPETIIVLAVLHNNPGYYPLAIEDNRYFLWGFKESPDKMTDIGKKLFINSVIWMANAGLESEN